jgi:hypothetical protein
MRREVRSAIGSGMDVLWEGLARLRWTARVRLAWRMLRGRGLDGKRLEGR